MGLIMDSMLLPILVAIAVILAAVSFIQFARYLLDPDRRKLQQRLATEKYRGPTSAASSIRLNAEAKGLSARLVKISLFNGIHRRILHAYPDMSLVGFLAIVSMLAIAAFSITLFFFDSAL